MPKPWLVVLALVALGPGLLPAGAVGPAVPTRTPRATPGAGTVLYQADWMAGRDGWTGAADWRALDGLLFNNGTNPALSPLLAPYQPPVADYAVEAIIQVVGLAPPITCGRLGVLAGAGPDAPGRGVVGGVRFCLPTSGQPSAASLWLTPMAQPVATHPFAPGPHLHTYRLEVKGNQVRLLIDGVPLLHVTVPGGSVRGKVGLQGQQLRLVISRFLVIAL